MSNEELLPPSQPKLDKGKGRAEEPLIVAAESKAEPTQPAPSADEQARPAEASQTADTQSVTLEPANAPSTASRQVPGPLQAPLLASTAVSPDASTQSIDRAQEHRPVQVMDLLSAQLGALGPAHQPRPAQHAVALTAGGASARRDGASPPPVWLDGAIGLVLVALASLLCRKVM